MTEKQFRRLAAALVVFATVLAYANTFANDFVWDDASSILLHRDVQNPSHILQLFAKDQHAYGRGQGDFYRPLVSLSFMIETILSHATAATRGTQQPAAILSPFVYHLGNTLWHAGVGIAMFAMMTILGAPRAVRLPATLLYVVHPLHTEAIAYISGRADPMAAFFMLLALCCALALHGPRRVVLSAFFFIAALLSKESATIFPFLLLLAALIFRKPPTREAREPAHGTNVIYPLIASGAVLGMYAALRLTVLNFSDSPASAAAPLSQRFLEAGQAFALYMKLIFLPANLHMERSLDDVPGWVGAAGWLLVLAFISALVLAYAAKRKRLVFALGFFIMTWLPISGIFPLNAPMAEHWMYLPLIGFSWAFMEIAWWIAGATLLRYPLYALVYAACLALIVVTVQRNSDWRNNETLYVATLKDNPNSIRVTYNLGVTYEDLTGNPGGARREFERVLRLYHDRKAAAGETDDTQTYYDDEMDAHLSLGKLYADKQMVSQALYHFDTLRKIQVNPSNAAIIGDAYLEEAKLLASVGQADDARKLLNEGMQRVPALKEQLQASERARQAAMEAHQGSAAPPSEQPAQ